MFNHTPSRLRSKLTAAWLALALFAPGLAHAELLHFQASDHINQTPVSAATPLPSVSYDINGTALDFTTPALVKGSIAAGVAPTDAPVYTGCNALSVLPAYTTATVEPYTCDVKGRVGAFIGFFGSANNAAGETDNADAKAATGNNQNLVVNSRGDLLNSGGTWDRAFTCNLTAAVSVTAAATTQIVGLSGSTVIRVCSVSLGISATGTVNVVTGTGTNCGTPSTISNAIPLVTGQMWQQTAPAGGSLFRSTAGGEICIAAVTGNVTGFITYAQF